jgi:hypothetical protein
MNELLKLLMHYQAKGNTILTQLHGSSVSLHDVLFYTLALCVPLVFITYPSDVRILLLVGVLACWGVERFVLQHWVMLFGSLRAGQTGSFGGNFSGGHDVKITVRLIVLGGTLGVVVWLLLKRRAAHNRREAILQAIQASVSIALEHCSNSESSLRAASSQAKGLPCPSMLAHACIYCGQKVACIVHTVAPKPMQLSSVLTTQQPACLPAELLL